MTTSSKQVTDVLEKIKAKYSPRDEEKLKKILSDVIDNGKSLAEAMNFTPDMLEEIYGVAQCKYSSGKYRDAASLFCYLISLDNSVPKYFLGAGACCHKLKNFDDAISFYARCAYLDETDPFPAYYASDCHLQLNDTDAALTNLILAILQSGDRPEYAILKERATMIRDSIIAKLGVKT